MKLQFSFFPDCEPSPSHLNLYIVDKIKVSLGPDDVGYLKISHISSERLRNIKTIWHYLFAFHGWCFDLEDRNKIWIAVHSYAKKSPESCPHVSPLALTELDIISKTVRDADLQKLSETYKPKIRKFISSRANFAFVDYINVEPNFRRQGIATQLYNVGAMWLALNRGLVLHSSSLQSKEAKAVWETMMKSEKFPISIASYRYDSRWYFYKILDYVSELKNRLLARKTLELTVTK